MSHHLTAVLEADESGGGNPDTEAEAEDIPKAVPTTSSTCAEAGTCMSEDDGAQHEDALARVLAAVLDDAPFPTTLPVDEALDLVHSAETAGLTRFAQRGTLSLLARVSKSAADCGRVLHRLLSTVTRHHRASDDLLLSHSIRVTLSRPTPFLEVTPALTGDTVLRCLRWYLDYSPLRAEGGRVHVHGAVSKLMLSVCGADADVDAIRRFMEVHAVAPGLDDEAYHRLVEPALNHFYRGTILPLKRWLTQLAAPRPTPHGVSVGATAIRAFSASPCDSSTAGTTGCGPMTWAALGRGGAPYLAAYTAVARHAPLRQGEAEAVWDATPDHGHDDMAPLCYVGCDIGGLPPPYQAQVLYDPKLDIITLMLGATAVLSVMSASVQDSRAVLVAEAGVKAVFAGLPARPAVQAPFTEYESTLLPEPQPQGRLENAPLYPELLPDAPFLDTGANIKGPLLWDRVRAEPVSSLRNPNIQLRSNPQFSAGPWQQSTVAPDTNRHPFELCGDY